MNRLSVREIEEAFFLLFSSMKAQKFSKTYFFNNWNEKELLPSLRFFLLGYFGKVLEPEYKTELLLAPSGEGYIDFIIANVAVEFAVRVDGEYASKITSYSNRTERVKLIRRNNEEKLLNKGVLILFDYSKSPLVDEQLEEYRKKPKMGRGNYSLDDFSILYFHSSLKDRMCVRKNIKF